MLLNKKKEHVVMNKTIPFDYLYLACWMPNVGDIQFSTGILDISLSKHLLYCTLYLTTPAKLLNLFMNHTIKDKNT